MLALLGAIFADSFISNSFSTIFGAKFEAIVKIRHHEAAVPIIFMQGTSDC